MVLIREYLPLVIGLAVMVLFSSGLVLALRGYWNGPYPWFPTERYNRMSSSDGVKGDGRWFLAMQAEISIRHQSSPVRKVQNVSQDAPMPW